jgi:hypothetical protein
MCKRLLALLVFTFAWGASSLAQDLPKPKADVNDARDQVLFNAFLKDLHDARAERDHAVIESVLKDLLSWADSPWEGTKGKADRKIYFARESTTLVRDPDTVIREAASKDWANVTPEQIKLAQTAANNLVNRLQEKRPFKEIKPTDNRIVVLEKKEADWIPEKASDRVNIKQVFRATVPGYSKDGQLAVVEVRFPWSGHMHDGAGVYLLAHKENAWVVLVRDFWLYE